ncbi:MAG: glycosyltransferase [Candidatus Caenarcaniphilales bacterium]|nr:glycosyltransferase [Candidatus Caenarcaniphilales bacterium]
MSESVCVVLATYNPVQNFFIQQIESIRRQTHTQWTCIIQDDFSGKKEFKEILSVISEDERFSIEKNKENLGVFKTFEAGLRRVPPNCNFIALADQDDIWNENKLEVCVRELQSNTEIALVHSDLELIDESNKTIQKSCWSFEKRKILNHDQDLLLVRNIVTGCSCVFKKKVLKKALPFPLQSKRDSFYHDIWITLKALEFGEIKPIFEPLVHYRQHTNNQVGVDLNKNNLLFQQVKKHLNNDLSSLFKCYLKQYESLNDLLNFQVFQNGETSTFDWLRSRIFKLIKIDYRNSRLLLVLLVAYLKEKDCL